MLDTDSTIQFYADLSGNPLQSGSVYFGAAGQNPVTAPITVYWDAAATQPAKQPILVKNGLTVRYGSAARVYIPSDYSKLVQDAQGRQVSFDAALAAPARTALAGPGGAALVADLLPYTGAAMQDISTVLRYQGFVPLTRFMSPADLADLALATPVRDQGPNLLNAIASGVKKILLPPGNICISSTVRLKDGVRLLGASSIQGAGSSIRFTKNDGTHCFDSDPALFLSGVSVQDIEIANTVNAAGNVATGDAFHLFALTNNCSFKNVLIRNFGGDGFSIGKQSTNLSDKTALQNVHFEQVFVVSCGGYAFDVDGYVNATWLMNDLNSCATGFFRFADGTTNQTQINLFGLWIEGTRTWTALTVFDMQDTKGQMLNLIGCNFTNVGVGTSRIVKSTTSSCRINAVGVTGFGWTNGLHEDTPAGINTPLSTPTNRFQSVITPQLQVQGAGPTVDLFEQVSGTTDQRRFRAGITANKLLISARADDGTSVRNLVTINHNTGAFEPGADNAYNMGTGSLRWSTIFAGTGTINTSDENEKEQIGDIPDAWLDAWGDVKWQRFKFKDAVAAKGADARWHIGAVAQQVRDAFAARGLNAQTIGLLCFDQWDDIYTDVTDADGKVTGQQLVQPAGSRWGLRYQECEAMEAAWARRALALLGA